MAAIKAGRRHRDRGAASEVPGASTRLGSPSDDERPPDSRRLFDAGAHPVLFWTVDGVTVEGEEQTDPIPLPGREEFVDEWRRRLPPSLLRKLLRRDCLIIEGRWDASSIIVQMQQRGVPAEQGVKFPAFENQLTVTGVEAFPGIVETILNRCAGD